MKERKRILTIRKHSRIAPSNKSLWFFSEDSAADDQSTITKRKSFKNDRESILNEDFNRYAIDDSEKSMRKKESPFIVDWQMSDTF